MSDVDEGLQAVAGELAAAGLTGAESVIGGAFPIYRLMSADGYLIAELWQDSGGDHWCATRFIRGYSQGTITGSLAQLVELAAGWAPTSSPEQSQDVWTSAPEPPAGLRMSRPQPPQWWRPSTLEPPPMSPAEPMPMPMSPAEPVPEPEQGPFAVGDRVIRCPDRAHGTVDVINDSGGEWHVGVVLDNGERSDGPAADLIFERPGRRLARAGSGAWSAGPPPERRLCRQQPSELNLDHSLTFCQRPPHATGPHLALDLRKDLVSWSDDGPVSHCWPGQTWMQDSPRVHPIDRPVTPEHRLEDRIRAHVILCWLALLLIRIAETTTGHTWANLREELQELHVGTFEGPAGTFRQRTELTTEQRDILGKLAIEPPKKIIELGPPTTS